MKSDNMTSRRILIFLSLAFLPSWVLSFIYMAKYGKTVDGAFYGLLGAFSMLTPAIANILTRVITKEGFKDCKFSIKFKGNVRYIIIALCFPVVSGYITAFVLSETLVRDSSILDVITKPDHINVAATALYCLGTSVLDIILGFGEEFGWRAYLMPKFEEKMPFGTAIVLSGIIWGLWHAPITVCGHNFGTDYPGYPYVGILLMCVSCIFIGLFLTSMVKATGSVLPAALGHIAFNNTAGTVSGTIFAYILTEEYVPSNSIEYPLVVILTSSVTALIAGLLILKIKRK